MILTCPQCGGDIANVGIYSRRGYCESCARWFPPASLFGKVNAADRKRSVDHRLVAIDRDDRLGLTITVRRRGVNADDLIVFFVNALILAGVVWFIVVGWPFSVVLVPLVVFHLLMISANLIGATESQQITVCDGALTLIRQSCIRRSTKAVPLTEVDRVCNALCVPMNPLVAVVRRMIRDSHDVSKLWMPTVEANGRRWTFGEWLGDDEKLWVTAHLREAMACDSKSAAEALTK